MAAGHEVAADLSASAQERTVYLNNAATSFPKPAVVIEAVARSLTSPPAEPGRGGAASHDVVAACREELAQLFAAHPEQVVVLPSATYAINQVLLGGLERHDHVITTVLEHNSVLRPLTHLRRDRDVEVTLLEPAPDGRIDCSRVISAMRPSTKLIAMTHASNVTGTIQPVEVVARLAARRGIQLLIDAAQSAGAIPLRHDFLPGRVHIVVAGHKGLLAPAGVGALIVPDDQAPQTVFGGTGVRSESLDHPTELPLRHEAGTPNLCGIAGLSAGVGFVRRRGVDREGHHRHRLVRTCREGLGRISGVSLLPLALDDGRAGIVSFTLEGWASEEVGFVLRQSFGIEVRSGLHCAPLAHRFFGTSPAGTVRASFGSFSTQEDVGCLVDAVGSLERRWPMARIVATTVVENCLDSSVVKEMKLDRPLERDLMQRLSHGAELMFYPHFPRPYFRVERARKYVVQGILGTTSLRVTFSPAAGESEERQLRQLIES